MVYLPPFRLRASSFCTVAVLLFSGYKNWLLYWNILSLVLVGLNSIVMKLAHLCSDNEVSCLSIIPSYLFKLIVFVYQLFHLHK